MSFYNFIMIFFHFIIVFYRILIVFYHFLTVFHRFLSQLILFRTATAVGHHPNSRWPSPQSWLIITANADGITTTYCSDVTVYQISVLWNIFTKKLIFSYVTRLFGFVTIFASVGILNSKPGDSLEVLVIVSESGFPFYFILWSIFM